MFGLEVIRLVSRRFLFCSSWCFQHRMCWCLQALALHLKLVNDTPSLSCCIVIWCSCCMRTDRRSSSMRVRVTKRTQKNAFIRVPITDVSLLLSNAYACKYTARLPPRHAALSDNYRLSQNEAWSVSYSNICVGLAADHFGLDPLLTKMRAKNDFYIFVPSDLDLWPLDLNFAPLVTLVHRLSYIEKIGGTGRTDGRTDRRDATLNACYPLGRSAKLSNMFQEISRCFSTFCTFIWPWLCT